MADIVVNTITRFFLLGSSSLSSRFDVDHSLVWSSSRREANSALALPPPSFLCFQGPFS